MYIVTHTMAFFIQMDIREGVHEIEPLMDGFALVVPPWDLKGCFSM